MARVVSTYKVQRDTSYLCADEEGKVFRRCLLITYQKHKWFDDKELSRQSYLIELPKAPCDIPKVSYLELLRIRDAE